MILPDAIVEKLRSNDFQHTYTNEYSGTDRFVRKIRDLPLNNRIYNNCAIVIETYADNYLTINIFGYTQRLGNVQNITREIFPGQYQFISSTNVPVMIELLERYPFQWASDFGIIKGD